MDAHGLTPSTLQAAWMASVQSYAHKTLSEGSIFWENAFNASAMLESETIFQVWKDTAQLHTIAQQGYHALYSAGWYVSSNPNWDKFWSNLDQVGSSIYKQMT